MSGDGRAWNQKDQNYRLRTAGTATDAGPDPSDKSNSGYRKSDTDYEWNPFEKTDEGTRRGRT